MKALWIDRETNTAKFVETDGSLRDMYRMCHCDCIDIATRKVEGEWVDIVVDDEGLLVGDPMISVFDTKGYPALAGSVVAIGFDNDGNFAGLSARQVEALANRTGLAMMNDFTMRTVLIID